MHVSYISKQGIPTGEEVSGKEIRKGIFEYILLTYPDFNEDHYISLGELNAFRRKYLTSLIQAEKGELKTLDLDVMQSIHNNETISDTFQNKEDQDLTFGQRMADKIAEFGGSWSFIISFFTFIVIWIAFNTFMLITQKFDPYPFILLNLILSCLASIQAPIIMMSQNRQEQKDRKRAEKDYKINLKAELEIKLLSEKMDHLLIHQNQKLLEIQEVQTDYLEDLMIEIRKIQHK